MRLLVVAASLVVCTLAAKERFKDGGSHADVNTLTEKLWIEIQKRLQDYDDKSDGLQPQDPRQQGQCRFDTEDGMIIRTQDSLNAGATFISAPTVNARAECEEECCMEENCNLAIFKAKVFVTVFAFEVHLY